VELRLLLLVVVVRSSLPLAKECPLRCLIGCIAEHLRWYHIVIVRFMVIMLWEK
jgi:hypothetical protein